MIGMGFSVCLHSPYWLNPEPGGILTHAVRYQIRIAMAIFPMAIVSVRRMRSPHALDMRMTALYVFELGVRVKSAWDLPPSGHTQ